MASAMVVSSALAAFLLVAGCNHPPQKPTEVLGPLVDTPGSTKDIRHTNAPAVPRPKPDQPSTQVQQPAPGSPEDVGNRLDDIDAKLKALQKRIGPTQQLQNSLPHRVSPIDLMAPPAEADERPR